MLTQRQELVLKLIVDEFLRTAEPVGSRTLSKLLDFSPATIRNEMADLEDLGFIEKTHTSSGRVPSDVGYRYYINNLMDSKDDECFTEIDDLFSDGIKKRDELIEQAMNLLSNMTNYTTIALGPKASSSRLKKIELVPLYSNVALLIIITNLGHVENKQITIPEDCSVDEMKRIIEIFNDVLYDTQLSNVSDKIKYELTPEKINDYMSYNQKIIDTFIEAFMKFTKSKYYLSGTSNMLYQPEFNDLDRVRELLRFFEQNDVLKLVENNDEHGLTVKIGHENTISAMHDCTVITVPYDASSDESGTIAIVGPRRMDYQKVIPLLKYLAKHITKLYKE